MRVGWLDLSYAEPCRRADADLYEERKLHRVREVGGAIPVQHHDHFHTVSQYVKRNALRASLVKRVEGWRWSSLYRWYSGTAKEKGPAGNSTFVACDISRFEACSWGVGIS